MNEKQGFTELQTKLLSVCEESGLTIKFDIEEYELEPTQEDTFLVLKEMNPNCAVAVGIKDEYIQRIFMLGLLALNEYEFVEISQNYMYISEVSQADDGVWELDEIETRAGNNW
ncbi:hypothetical protein ATG66_2044 [Vibrio sp. ES.051]|uniref:hypothetical protein n=1 Tax=Vibrio sp. ES.051 TaxID=1761909 RepID=UPI000BF6B698|nr:hypothetical protein [Vibrio sp. ES.051]PFG55728.1 hypothetical protein ATG66_2044 [Vibrio sp. ES.051]